APPRRTRDGAQASRRDERTRDAPPSFPSGSAGRRRGVRHTGRTMLVRLLPSHGRAPLRFQPFTTFLIDRQVALDAGSLGFGLTLAEQRRVRHVVVSHTHADHTASLPIFVAEVYPFLKAPIVIHAPPVVLSGLRRHVFNGRVWPDFRRIALEGSSRAALEYRPCRYGRPFTVEG